MLRWFSSIRVSLLILVFLAIIPAVGLSIYNAGERRQQDAENAQRDALALTRLVSGHQERLISETRQLLTFLSRQPEIRTADTAACSAYLANELEQNPIYSGIGVADLNGDLNCSALPSSETVNVADRSHFQGALQSNDFTIGNYQIGLITGRGVLPFGFPVHDGQGNLSGVVMAGLELGWLNEFVSTSELPPGSTVTVMDENGVILARFPESEVSPGRSIAQRPLFRQMVATEDEGLGEATGLDGVPRLYAFKHLGGEGQSGEMYVSIGIPKSVAYAPADQALRRYLVGLGAVLFLTLGIAWFGADLLMMRRVRGLVAATQKLASGDFKSRSTFPHRSGEFGLLAQAFDGMAQELEEREEERTERIREQVRRTEAEAAQERITNILESIKDGFFAVDHHGRFTFLNQNAARTFQKLTGQTAEELIGKDMWEDAPEFSGSQFYEKCQRAIARQVSVQFEEFNPRLKAWLEVHAHPNRDGLSIFFQDITERKQAQEEKSRLAAIVESADDAILSSDLDGAITSWNRGAAQLYGYTAEEAIGQPLTMLIPPERHDEGQGILERIRRGELIQHYETIRRRKDGTLLDISLTVSPIVNSHGHIEGASKIARDITDQKRAEQALRESEERFRMATSAGKVGVWDWDVVANTVTWSDTLYGIHGLAPGAFGGTVEAFAALVHEDDRDYMNEAIQRALNEDAPYELELRTRRPDGGIAWIYTQATVMRDDSGAPRRMLGATVDITALKNAELALRESEERHELVLAGAGAAIWDWDVPAGRILYSTRWKELRGFTEDEIGESEEEWMSRVHPDDFQRVWNSLQEHFDGSTPVFSEEYRVRHKDGHWIWVLDRGLANKDASGQVLRMAGSETDITERKQAEETLREADRQKDQFLAMLSHELRNPLAPIANAVELLRRDGSDSAIQQEALGVLERQVNTITRLINDLLDVSRVTTGRIQIRQEDVDLRALVLSVANSFRPQMAHRKIEFSESLPSGPPWVHGDSTRLEQVISNLLSNAARYTPQGGQVWLSLTEDQGQALIRVKDSGIGIEPHFLPHVFELFSQGQSTPDRAEGGLGIGLPLVKSLVEVHGGTVTAHSQGPGQGSEFCVWLPTVEAPAAPPELLPEESAVTREPALKVLLVDDAVDTRMIFGRLLEKLGNEVRTAGDGRSALETAREFRPDVVLLDIGLPGMDGYEVARQMRQEPVLQEALLVAVTGYGQKSDRQRSQEAGFNHHLVKPIDINSLEQLFSTVAGARTV